MYVDILGSAGPVPLLGMLLPICGLAGNCANFNSGKYMSANLV